MDTDHRRRVSAVVTAVTVVLAMGTVPAATGAAGSAGCDTIRSLSKPITSPGCYDLQLPDSGSTPGVGAEGSPGLDIQADDVIVHGNDNLITPVPNSGLAVGIDAENRTNVTIRNLTVASFSSTGIDASNASDIELNGTVVNDTRNGPGVTVSNATDVEVRSTRLRNNSQFGLNSTGGENVTLENVTVLENGAGVAAVDATDVLINDSNVSAQSTGNGDGDGIVYENVTGGAVNNTLLFKNGGDGLTLSRTTRNVEIVAVNASNATGTDSSGVVARNSSALELENVTASDNSGFGVAVLAGSTGVSIRDVTAERNAPDGVHVENATDIRVDGATLTGQTDHGLEVDNATNVTAVDATATNNAASGILATSSVDVDVGSSNVSSNDAHGLLYTNVSDGGTDSATSTVSNATAINNEFSGLRIAESSNVVSVNVTGRSSGSANLFASNSSDVRALNSTFNNSADHGVRYDQVEDGLVANTTAGANSKNGVLVGPDSVDTSLENVTAAGNGRHGVRFLDAREGVFSGRASNNARSGLLVSNATTVGVGGFVRPGGGVNLTRADNALITNNGDDGIRINADGNPDAASRNVSVLNATIRDNTDGINASPGRVENPVRRLRVLNVTTTSNAATGIDLDTVDTALVAAVNASRNSDSGVLVGRDSTNLTLEGINASDPTGNTGNELGIDVQTASNVTVTDLTATGVTGFAFRTRDSSSNVSLANATVSAPSRSAILTADTTDAEFRSVTVLQSGGAGFTLNSPNRTVIDNVTVRSAGSDGLRIDGPTGQLNVTNTTVRDTVGSGISVAGGTERLSVTNVSIDNATIGSGILLSSRIDNATFDGLSVTDTGSSALQALGPLDGVRIRGSLFANTTVGVRFFDRANDTTVSNVTVRDADVGLSASVSASTSPLALRNVTLRDVSVNRTTDDGVFLGSVENVTVRGLVVSDAGAEGVEIGGSVQNSTFVDLELAAAKRALVANVVEDTTIRGFRVPNNTRFFGALNNVTIREVDTDGGKFRFDSTVTNLTFADAVVRNSIALDFAGFPSAAGITLRNVTTRVDGGTPDIAFEGNVTDGVFDGVRTLNGSSVEFNSYVTNTSVDVGQATVSLAARSVSVPDPAGRTGTPAPPTGWTGTGIGFSLSVGDRRSSYANVTVGYTGALGNAVESSLALWRNNQNGQWMRSDGTLDTTANTITRNFTAFLGSNDELAILANETESSSSSSAPTGSPASSITDDDLAFGTLTSGTSATRTFDLANTGTAPLEVSNVTVTGTAFTVDPVPTPLAPDERRTVSVTFAPSTAGAYNGSVTVATNASDPTVDLSGAAVGGNVSLSTTGVSFGSVVAGSGATNRENVTVTNTGTGNLTLSGLSVSGEAFSLLAGETGVLAPGESRTLTLGFRAADAGELTGALTVETNDPERPAVTVTLSGTADPAPVTVRPAVVEFGTVSGGERATMTLSVENPSAEEVRLTNLTITGPAADRFGVNATAPVVLPPGTTRDLTVSLRPTRPGNRTATLRIGRNGTPLTTVDLRGRGVAPAIAVDPTSVSFTDAVVNRTSLRRVVVSSVGNRPLNLTGVNVSGEGFASSSPSRVLEPGETVSLLVEFTPTETAARTGRVVFLSNATRRPILTLTTTTAELNVTTEPAGNGSDQRTTAQVTDASAGEPVDIPVTDPGSADAADNATVEQVSLTPERNGSFRVNVTTSEDPLGTTPEFVLRDTEGTRSLEFYNVTAGISNRNISEANVRVRILKERLAELGTDPEDVVLFRFQNGTWQEQPTRVVAETNRSVLVVGNASGLSEWTAAATRPRFNITGTRTNVTAATTNDVVTIQVFVQNTGGADGRYVAELLLNDEVVDTRRTAIPEGGQTQLNFRRTFAQPGLYEVQVNDVPVGEVNISAVEEAVDVSTPTEPTPTEPTPTDDGTTSDTETSPGPGASTATGSAAPGDGTETGTETAGGGGPGPGVVGAVLAVLLAAVLARRRR